MKNVTKRLVALLLLICSAVALVGCASSTTTYYYDEATGTWSDTATNSGNNGGVNNNTGNNNNGSLAVEVSDVKQEIRYIDDDGMITPVLSNELKYRTRYTLELSFVITPNMDSDGTQFLDTVLTFADINILNGSIKEAETGKQDVSQTIDAGTGKTRKDITLSFKIPAERDVEKKVTILVGIDPLEVADSSSMQVDFKSDDARVLGDGIIKSYSIVKDFIETPILDYDENDKKLSWNHVKNATYYKLYYNDNKELVDYNGNPVIIYANDINVGASITLDATTLQGYYYRSQSGDLVLLPPYAEVCVQAFNEDTNYANSNKSNAEEIKY